MRPIYVIATAILGFSPLSAQTEAQISDLSHRLESAWSTNTDQAFDALYCKVDADQYQIDTKVNDWVGNKAFDKEATIKVVKFWAKAEIEKAADPKSGDVNHARYRSYLDGMTKPVPMNGNSYIQNLTAVGIIEVEITGSKGSKMTRFISVGQNGRGTLLFTLLKRG